MIVRTYTELRQLGSLEERFEFLRLNQVVGDTTFGFDRWMNQLFYKSREWRQIRDEVIVRDNGFDLGTPGMPISGAYLIHHMNPLTQEDIELATDNLLDPEFLITTSLKTHNAVHWGDKSLLPVDWTPRRPNDTIPWRKGSYE